MLAQRVLVDGEYFLVGQRLHVGFGDERMGHELVAIRLALRGFAQVAGQGQGTCQHAPQRHLRARLCVGQSRDLASVGLMSCRVVAGSSQAVQTNAHHVEVVESVYASIHPQATGLIDTSHHARPRRVADPVLARVTCGSPAAPTCCGAPCPGLGLAPFADIIHEGGLALLLASLVEGSHGFAHSRVAHLGAGLAVAVVVFEHIDAPRVKQGKVLVLKAV